MPSPRLTQFPLILTTHFDLHHPRPPSQNTRRTSHYANGLWPRPRSTVLSHAAPSPFTCVCVSVCVCECHPVWPANPSTLSTPSTPHLMRHMCNKHEYSYKLSWLRRTENNMENQAWQITNLCGNPSMPSYTVAWARGSCNLQLTVPRPGATLIASHDRRERSPTYFNM